MTRRTSSLAMTLMLVATLAACTSPEATRQRAGGSGSDVGNKTHVIRMHEGSDPYYDTPVIIGRYGEGAPALEASRQADRLSRAGGSASPK